MKTNNAVLIITSNHILYFLFFKNIKLAISVHPEGCSEVAKQKKNPYLPSNSDLLSKPYHLPNNPDLLSNPYLPSNPYTPSNPDFHSSLYHLFHDNLGP